MYDPKVSRAKTISLWPHRNLVFPVSGKKTLINKIHVPYLLPYLSTVCGIDDIVIHVFFSVFDEFDISNFIIESRKLEFRCEPEFSFIIDSIREDSEVLFR
jgi:hypothetical protein